MRYEELTIEGRNAVLEAFRSKKTIDKLFISGRLPGRAGAFHRPGGEENTTTIISYVAKERLDQMSETGKHQGVIAYAAAYEYARRGGHFADSQKDKGEPPFIIPAGRHRGSP